MNDIKELTKQSELFSEFHCFGPGTEKAREIFDNNNDKCNKLILQACREKHENLDLQFKTSFAAQDANITSAILRPVLCKMSLCI